MPERSLTQGLVNAAPLEELCDLLPSALSDSQSYGEAVDALYAPRLFSPEMPRSNYQKQLKMQSRAVRYLCTSNDNRSTSDTKNPSNLCNDTYRPAPYNPNAPAGSLLIKADATLTAVDGYFANPATHRHHTCTCHGTAGTIPITSCTSSPFSIPPRLSPSRVCEPTDPGGNLKGSILVILKPERFKGDASLCADPEMTKWWKRRYDLFERFDDGIELDKGTSFWLYVLPIFFVY
ncbi:unnamed protein product [Schistocephalus solidus]|uniref:Uncharacterized protein n=1 Tax=Schistocephalus solidus TaxID=70667 RepID=A0A183T7M8_SCHSO|nr:unnamed protein product [Schistocephalus solidus]